jgi:hypothetical protein
MRQAMRGSFGQSDFFFLKQHLSRIYGIERDFQDWEWVVCVIGLF